MKNKIINALLVITLVVSFACNKNSTTPDTSATNTTNNAVTSFTWAENGGAVQTADSAYWTTGTWGTGVRASKGGFTNYFEINWATQNNTSVGSKALSAGDLTFIKGATTYTNSASENLNVTAFNATLLSGNFTSTLSGGTITSITGGFINIKQK